MQVRYGVGLLPLLPEGHFAPKQEEPERRRGPGLPPKRRDTKDKTAEARKTWLEEAGKLGFSQLFYEVVQDQYVVEVSTRGGGCTTRWLPDAEANRVIAQWQRIGIGSLLHDQLPRGFDADIWVPGYTGRGNSEVPLPGFRVRANVDGLQQAVQFLRREINNVPSADRIFVKELMTAVEAANANRFCFWLDWVA